MDIVKTGYEVKAAHNGGFIVSGYTDKTLPWGSDGSSVAAFSNATDLIAWLSKQHGVPMMGGYTVPPEAMEVVRKMVSEPHVTVTVNGEDAPASTGLAEAVRKAVEKTKFREPPADDWTPFDFTTDTVPEFAPGTLVSVEYTGGRWKKTDPGAIDWTRVTRYRVI